MNPPAVEAVTVCVGYADFLAESVRWNAHHFRQWVVVTSPRDKETQAVCRRHRLRCIVTEDDQRDGVFSKGRLVERGLQHLSADTWVLHLDADIVLPMRFDQVLGMAHLDPSCLYGCDRFMVRNYADWQRLLAAGWVAGGREDHPHAVEFPAGYQLGARWAGGDGYVPIGFFQLWNRSAGGEEVWGYRTKAYPANHGNACRGDVQHGLQWDRRKRVLLPELVVAHLESEKCKRGANWEGRTTKRFGPPAVATAAPLGVS